MTTVVDAVAATRRAKDKVETVRDMLPLVADELERNSTQRLFESAFMDVVPVMSKSARSAVLTAALESGGPLMSCFNEYVQYMELVRLIVHTPVSTWDRPSNPQATAVMEANNPLGMAYSLLRQQKSLSPLATASILEAAFPLAVAGLDEVTRNRIYTLASERGVSPIEVANVYAELMDMVASVRFLEDSDG